MLTLKTFKKFGITSDPFTGDVVKADDVYLTDEARFIAEYLLQAAKKNFSQKSPVILSGFNTFL
jgi:hypothetical protein